MIKISVVKIAAAVILFMSLNIRITNVFATTANNLVLPNFSLNRIEISKDTWTISVKDLLQNIKKEGLSSWKEFDPNNQLLIDLSLQIETLKKAALYSIDHEEITAILFQTYLLLLKINRDYSWGKLTDITNNIVTPNSTTQANYYFYQSEICVKITPSLDEMSSKVLTLLQLLSTEKDQLPSKAFKQEVIQEIHNIEILTEITLISAIPYNIREQYHLIWNEFFRVIIKHILPDNNYLLLQNKIESLNFTWNDFYQRVSKERLPVYKKHMGVFKRIDDSWNSIIRTVARYRH
ncbi:MAG: hypothetical protein HQK53_02505 [Oligoflexia bacterium]|nr:hypothetical protein [Oligoflexia bacterium]